MFNLNSFFFFFTHLLSIDKTIVVILAGVVGLLVGSFLNVVIYRVPAGLEKQWIEDAAEGLSSPVDLAKGSGWSLEMATQFTVMASALVAQMQSLPKLTISKPRSRCPHCGHAITWYENIPVFSWLYLRAKCSACSSPISMRYPLVELCTAMVFALVAVVLPGAQTVWGCGAAAALIAMAMIDFDTMLLPDSLTLPMLWAGLIGSALGFLVPVQMALLGAAAGYIMLWSLYWTFKLLTGKEGMGYGDFKLMAALGAWFGLGAIPAIALISAVLGILAHVTLRLTGRLKEDQPMPFGPYLAGAGLLFLLVPTHILKLVFPMI